MTMELSSTLLGVALRLTRRRDQAEDLVQETLFRAYRGLSGFRKGTNFRAWLFRIQHNAFLTGIARAGTAPRAVDMEAMDPQEPDHAVPDIRGLGELPSLADRHFDDRVKAALDSMADPFREAFVLMALGGLSYAEIAETLEVPTGTVMSRIFRARVHLRRELLEFAREHGYREGSA